MKRAIIVVAVVAAASGPWLGARYWTGQRVAAAVDPPRLELPLNAGSVRFAVIGDFGTGERPQYEIGRLLEKSREAAGFDFVLTVGDNIYGSRDLSAKFERPYAALLRAGVTFHATLGNHDDLAECNYEPFHMGGRRYYSFRKKNVEFWALDSNRMDDEQVEWLRGGLAASDAEWKICFFHHPLYSNARRHGPSSDLRRILEPLLVSAGANVVLSGHDHVYERLNPQRGIYYFVAGSSGQLRPHDLKPSVETARGYDEDCAYLLFEIAGAEAHFQAISRNGRTVDAGMIGKPSGAGGEYPAKTRATH